ncbi:RICIN domain-containing protein [Streptomyces sp. NPDC047916]|uniref:RICIN domain-containing protein n=1 Tax=Streptomyces sp. NPDC047916 TaxID=3156681 RepID=UPI003453AFAF
MVSRATGKVADVADCSTADGADVRQWTWLTTPASSSGSCRSPEAAPPGRSVPAAAHRSST